MATTSVDKLLIRLQKFSSKVSKVVDATDSFNTTGSFYQDLSGWDSAVVQFVNPSAAITFKTTNDDDSVTGQLLPAPEVPNNWIGVTGVNLLDKSDATSIATDGIVEFGIIGKYLLLEGAETANPLSYAYLLSQPTPNLGEAYNSSLQNGAKVVYASTDNQGGVQKFFGDSRLTLPVYGNGTDWYGFRLLSQPSNNVYACTISSTGSVSID
jgi:hypothetical protein